MLRYANDAPQQAFSFLLSQLTYIESQMWETKYPAITYQDFVPVDYSAPEWIKTVTYMTKDGTGKAKFMSGSAEDFPLVGLTRDKLETNVEMAGIGYDYTIEELEQSRMLGIPLTADKAAFARRAYEELCEDVAYVGDATKNWKGLFNNADVTATNVVAGVGGVTWVLKTPNEILKDVNTALTGIWTTTLGIAIADTLLLPMAQYADIATRRLSDTSDRTVLSWILENNIYTLTTGQRLTIRANRFLTTAGAGGTARMVAYRKSPEVVKMHIPMRLRFLQPQGPFGMRFQVPGIFRLGGVDVRLPKEIRYYDGI